MARPAETLAIEKTAEAAHWSPFHFHRVFSAVMGLPPPASYRRSSGSLVALNPSAPNPRAIAHRAPCLAGEPTIERFGPLRLACASAELPLDGPSLLGGVRALWAAAARGLARAAGLPDGAAPARSFGLAEPSEAAPGERIRYLAGVEPSADWKPGARSNSGDPPLTAIVIPEGEYLTAIHKGPVSRLNETYLYLYGSWLSKSGIEPGAVFDFDEYGDAFDSANPESVESEITFRIPLRISGDLQ